MITIQSEAHEFDTKNITHYSLMSGLNVTNEVLKQYDPYISGYRLFILRKPLWVSKYFEESNGKTFKFDADYSMPVKMALATLAMYRSDAILYLDTNHNKLSSM